MLRHSLLHISNPQDGRFLQVSGASSLTFHHLYELGGVGLKYEWYIDSNSETQLFVQVEDAHGVLHVLDIDQEYSLALSSFLAHGGDGCGIEI